ncbi:DeoR/GlpR family DNA-binding transcription regulator [Kineosporia sp. NBRC 101731]|uniref:DeoR/GlpR family DNA-binding transcription regulator n=1 Tax=Kineosporia sp. NBRC 101731 TaxID=3032199 RepID=UPI0024A155AD|nr:DeoR/GlpR family DNA-binding transcription regulator [Kineosporia sp. NBRC 101731]GLY29038.1 DeoR family transcriptional regulator [Kineosporia sp. NBRC 101731]
MRQEDRLGLILERLSRQNTVGVPELARELEVSQASVRRDLARLEEQNLLTRTHGGAVASGVLYELPMKYRGGRRQDAKRLIALRAAELIPAGVTSVALNGGSTTTEVARVLVARPRLRVVTNALNIASELAVRTHIDLVVCGGTARAESYELIGPIAETTLNGLNPDVAVIGVDGISARTGLTTHHEVEAQTNRAMLLSAETVIVVADGTKIGRRGFARISEIAAVSDLVTDSTADPDAVAELRKAGLRVHQV